MPQISWVVLCSEMNTRVSENISFNFLALLFTESTALIDRDFRTSAVQTKAQGIFQVSKSCK